MRPVLLLSLLTILGGCTLSEDSVRRFVSPGSESAARAALELAHRGPVDSLVSMFPAAIDRDTARTQLLRLDSLMATARLDSSTLIGGQITATLLEGRGEIRSQIVELLTPAPPLWVGTRFRFEEHDSTRVLLGLDWDTYTADPRLAAAFGFSGKGVVYYLWLLMMTACAAYSISAAVRVGREPGFRRKWLFVPVALIGVGTVTLNWTTGAWGISPFNFLLFGAAAAKDGVIRPWMVSFAFPAGAFLAMNRVHAWRERSAASLREAAAPPAEAPGSTISPGS